MGSKRAAKIAARLRDYAPALLSDVGRREIASRSRQRAVHCRRSQVAAGGMCKHAECAEHWAAVRKAVDGG